MRVLIGGMHHKTNTFSDTPSSFDEPIIGQAIVEKFQETTTALGGFLAGAALHGFEAVPAFFVQAPFGGPIAPANFEEQLDVLCQHIQQAGDIDALLLDLHGGMAVDGISDADGVLLAKVRDAVGHVPILAQLNMHANVSPQMVENADVLIGGETFPEIDLAARGRECAEILDDMTSEYVKPTMGLYQMPLIWGENQITAVSPMRDAIAYMHEIENRPGVIKASLALGNPFADVPEMGASAYVVTEGNLSLAQQYAKELGIYCTVRRKDWHDLSQATDESLRLLTEHGQNINLRTIDYKNLGRALYPFDEIRI
ncbi:MAG: M81 family metallopeptidase [Chloroflexota bacterium]